MALSAGDRLGPYEILEPLGAGGMGAVYRAKDTKLGRDVAIKVLTPERAGDAERLARFEREAHLLASLNHPNIAAIYGFEQVDGTPFLALELVEGEELRERLSRGAMPLDEALPVAEQVARALEEAHRKGIVHRDLKPANVKLTPDGGVKVLDFGLAKAWSGEAKGQVTSASMSQSPTLPDSGTMAGVILGTAAYMSPEQARGKPVDQRGDVWAFGVLLWEMLTGRALFTGDSVTDVLAGVIKEEPDLGALPADTPPVVRRLIARCLRKDPRTRLPDIGAARLDLQEVLAGGTEQGPFGGLETGKGWLAERGRLSRQRWVWAAACVVAMGIAAYLAFAPRPEARSTPPLARFVVEAPEGWSFFWDGWPRPSPDGRHILMYAESAAGGVTPWLRSLDSQTPRRLTSMEPLDLGHVFWSPDSRFIGFAAEGELRKLNIADDVVQTICALPQGLDYASWAADGTIVFTGGSDPWGLYTVRATGGEPKPLLMPDAERGESFFAGPQLLSDGRRVLFVAGRSEPDWELLGIFITSLDSPNDRRLLTADVEHYEAVESHLVFNREDALFVRPLDLARGELTGEPIRIASPVAVGGRAALGAFGVSPGGTLAYLSGEDEQRRQLAWVDRQGSWIETVGEPRRYQQIVLSPDQKRVAAQVLDPERFEYDLWVIDLVRGVSRRLTSDPGHERDPVWSPDSQEVAYWSSGEGENRLFRKGLSGQPAVAVPGERGTDDESRDRPEGWSTDGSTLLVKKVSGTTVWALPLEEGGRIETVLDLEHRLDEPAVSPDGRWLAYTSEESGARWEVYVQPFRGSGERVRVSLEGGGQPQWRGDGKELFFLRADGWMMAVDVREGTAGPDVSRPTALFELEPSSPWVDHYAVSADGQRFLVRQRLEEQEKLQMHVVLNWQSLLEQPGE